MMGVFAPGSATASQGEYLVKYFEEKRHFEMKIVGSLMVKFQQLIRHYLFKTTNFNP